MIEYRWQKEFTQEQLQQLFQSVGWYSGNFPQKLQSSFANSSQVICAFDDDELAGLVRAQDDGCWQAIIDCVVVNPKYQGQGIASQLLKLIKEKYKDYLYLYVIPEEKKNVAFYQKQGFRVMEEGTAMQIAGNWEK